MGFIDRILGELSEREKLLADAQAVGNANEVIRMGILCAQLGLTEEDVPKMARVYLVLQSNQPDSDMWVEQVMRVIRKAHRGD